MKYILSIGIISTLTLLLLTADKLKQLIYDVDAINLSAGCTYGTDK